MESQTEAPANRHMLIAPKILGNDAIKKVLLLQLFANPASERINTLLIGEVATGKSVLLNCVLNMSPIGVSMGKKTTPAGFIEASENADTGIILADEFDKWDNEVREHMLEMMQFGKTTVTLKSGQRIVRSRSNLLAACNPVNNKLIRHHSLIAQVPFELPTMSRFHILLPFWSVDPDLYPDIAAGMVSEIDEDAAVQLMRDTVKDFRRRIPFVEVSKELAMDVGDVIQDLKRASPERDMISPRLIEGAINMIRANSRINNRHVANKNDLVYVVKILETIYLEGGVFKSL